MSDLFEETRPTAQAPGRTLKALSLWQPWASLVAHGLKLRHTPLWATDYRGLLAIHAAKTLDLAGAPSLLCNAGLGRTWGVECPLGAVVAVARVKSCHRADDVANIVSRADRAAGDYSPGRFAWELAAVRPLLEPIPLAGRQGLFNWTAPHDLEQRLGPILDHAAACAAIGWGR